MRGILRRFRLLLIAPALLIAVPQSGQSAEAQEPAASLPTGLAVRVPILPTDRAAAEADVAASIAIPLGVVRWDWSGTADYNAKKATWKLTASTKKTEPLKVSAVFPTWTTQVSTGAPTCN